MPATSDLPSTVTKALDKWWANVTTDEPPYNARGLWVQAPRGGGSSYVAHRAMRRCHQRLDWGFQVGQFKTDTTAETLVASIKEMWQLEAGVRSHQNDHALFEESQRLGAQVDYWLRSAPAVLIDDVHQESHDNAFWKKHIWGVLEGHIKRGGVVIIATDVLPTEVRGEFWPNMWVYCDAER